MNLLFSAKKLKHKKLRLNKVNVRGKRKTFRKSVISLLTTKDFSDKRSRRIEWFTTRLKLASLLQLKGQKFKTERLLEGVQRRLYENQFLYGFQCQQPLVRSFNTIIKKFWMNIDFKSRPKGKSGTIISPRVVTSQVGKKKISRWWKRAIFNSRHKNIKPFFWQVYMATLDLIKDEYKEFEKYETNYWAVFRENKYKVHFRWLK